MIVTRVKTGLITACLLLTILFLQQHTIAQSRGNNRLLSYEEFKTECIQFNRNQNSEMWVVYFWSSLNSSSLYDVPSISRLAQQYQYKPIRFIGVSENRNESRWKQALQDYNLPGDQVIISNVENLLDIKRAFQYERLPGYFVVDRQGFVYNPTNISGLRNFLSTRTGGLPNVANGGNTAVPVVNTSPERQRPSSSNDSNTVDWIFHTVQPGETLYRLQVKYDTPVENIRKLNGLSGNTIRVGQRLKIKRR